MAGVCLLADYIRSRKHLNIWVHWGEDWRWSSAGFHLALEWALAIVVTEALLRSNGANIWSTIRKLVGDRVDLRRKEDWGGVRANRTTNER